jgi:O-antigen/teichoic acid export membrane protein
VGHLCRCGIPSDNEQQNRNCCFERLGLTSMKSETPNDGGSRSRLRAIAGNRLLGSGLISLLIKVAGAGLSYVMFVAFARMLSPDQYGSFAFAFNLAVVIASVIGFGYSTAILRYWPKYLASGEPHHAKGAIEMGLWLITLGSVTALSAVFLLALVAPGSVREISATSIVLLAITFCGADFASGVLRAQSSVVGAMLPRDVLWRVIAPAAAGLLTWYGFRLDSSVAVYLCAAILGALLVPQAVLILKATQRLAGAVARQTDWRRTYSSLLPLWGASVVFAMIQQFDVVVVGYLLSGAETGAYFAAQKTAALLSLVLIAAGLVAAPSMAALYQSRSMEELQKLSRQLVTAITAATALGFVFLVLAGKPLLSLFNPGFVSAYWILIILASASLVDALSGPTAYLMQMTSFESAYLKIMVVCYALVVALQFALIPSLGGIGAAIATACGTIMWNVWAIWLLRSKASLDPSLFGLLRPVVSRHLP